MQERRFLRNSDYLAIIDQKYFDSITNGNIQKIIDAEDNAEVVMMEYLSELYEIDKELNKGKYIGEYDPRITYPVGVHICDAKHIYKVTRSIAGYIKPTAKQHWVYSDRGGENTPPYSQLSTYRAGDIVRFGGRFYECIEENGYEFDDIRIPMVGVEAWSMVDNCFEWDASTKYNLNDVVIYDGVHYCCIGQLNDQEELYINPLEDYTNWGEIAQYDASYDKYVFDKEGYYDYVVYDNHVFYPIKNVNPGKMEEGMNVVKEDPRHKGLKKHMVRIAIYELVKTITPNCIGEVRLRDYDESIKWLSDSAKLRINPMIPRKINKEGEELTTWQVATFQSDYNPYKNAWHV